jgi:hypothetical protein
MPTHAAVLNWTASTDVVDGYNVLRSQVSGGPYTKLNTAIVVGTTFTDVGPFPNLGPFFYVAQSVHGTTVSPFSNETPAVFLPPFPPTNLVVASVS